MSKFRPVFDISLFTKLGYSTDGSYHPSFEEQVMTFNPSGNPCYSHIEDKTRFTVNRLPELVSSLVWHLKNRHQLLTSQAAAERFLTRAGVLIVEKIPALKELNQGKDQGDVDENRDFTSLGD